MTKTGLLIYTADVSGKLVAFIVTLTIVSFGLRLFRLTEPNHYYFDEVYHAVTAKAYADNDPNAYDPFASPPKKDTAYDWLHPPLAKLIQAGSIKTLGDSPLGWRLPSAIFGSLIIPATFFLALALFGPAVAVFASLVIAFENLNLVMSRITMNDVFVTLFVIFSFIFASLYAKSRKLRFLILTGIFLGLAVSSKWTGVYAVISLFFYLLFISVRRLTTIIRLSILIFIPVVIYLASYGQFWLQGHSLGQFIDLHKQIWWYQNRHDLTHPYGSTPLYCMPGGTRGRKEFCPWVLDIRPVYFSYEEYGQKSGYTYALGNPLIFFLGVSAVVYCLGKIKNKFDVRLTFILVGYFTFWVPWIWSPRILFLYHYLPSLPFLSILLGIMFVDLYRSRYRKLSIFLMTAIIIFFVYFYPITSGLPISPSSLDRFMWFPTWR